MNLDCTINFRNIAMTADNGSRYSVGNEPAINSFHFLPDIALFRVNPLYEKVTFCQSQV